MGRRYAARRDALSAVLLLEAALGEAGPAIKGLPAGGAGGPGAVEAKRALSAAGQEVAELMYALTPPEARPVGRCAKSADVRFHL